MALFVRTDQQPAAIWEEPSCTDILKAWQRKRPRLTGARRIDRQVRVRKLVLKGDGPFSVGRHRDCSALAQSDSGRAIGLAHVNRITRAAALSGLEEQDSLAVPRKTRWARPVEPGEVPFFRLTRNLRRQPKPPRLINQDDTPIARNILDVSEPVTPARRRSLPESETA